MGDQVEVLGVFYTVCMYVFVYTTAASWLLVKVSFLIVSSPLLVVSNNVS